MPPSTSSSPSEKDNPYHPLPQNDFSSNSEDGGEFNPPTGWARGSAVVVLGAIVLVTVGVGLGLAAWVFGGLEG